MVSLTHVLERRSLSPTNAGEVTYLGGDVGQLMEKERREKESHDD
jgi:hypothetical protein